ncbi:kinase-like protein [Mycena latifolia]|nr:kinase-like protein [Mycena latifolia]
MQSNSAATFKWVRGEFIKQGAYSRVYLGFNTTTGEILTVKQIAIPTGDDQRAPQNVTLRALKAEIETLKDLDHPNIVQYIGSEETPATLSLFLEYVSGDSLASCLLKYGRFEEEAIKSFTSQILAGLEYLHSQGIMHRNLKCEHILVEASGICKISDFELAKRDDSRSQNDAAHTDMLGAVFWLPPEMITPANGYNSKIDIWSLGCVALEMWAGGTRPWHGFEMIEVMVQLGHSKLQPPVPDGVVLTPLADDFRTKCFAMNPEERPTATELRNHPYLALSPGWVFGGFAADTE